MHRLLPLLSLVLLGAGFTDLPVEEAKVAPGLVVIELSTDDACPAPAVWDEAAVQAWLGAHATTLVKPARTASHVEAVLGDGFRPAMARVAYRDGKELDRICGCMDGPTFSRWLAAVDGGGTRADLLEEDMEKAGGGLDIGRMLALVQVHHCAHRENAALSVLLDLWERIPEEAPEQREVRLSRVAHDMGVLAQTHPPAREWLVGMRDQLTTAKDTDGTALDEWVVLNRVLLQDEVTVAWYREHAGDKDMAELLERQAPNVFYLLVEQGAWADAGRVVGDPVAWLAAWRKMPGGLDDVAKGYAALLAAGRAADAAKLAKSTLAVDRSASCRLLARSVEVGATDRSQKKVASACEDEAVVAAWTATL